MESPRRGRCSPPRPGLPALVACAALCFTLVASCVSSVPPRDLALEYYNLGNAYFELKKYDKAADYYAKAYTYDNTLEASEYNLAVTYMESGKPEKALPIFQKLFEADPGNAKLTAALAYAYAKSGDSEKAIEVYSKILEYSPYDAVSFYNYAILLRGAGKTEEALGYFAKVYEATPDDSEALYRLSEAEMALEKYDSAVPHLESLRSKKADDLRGLRLLATAYDKTKFYDKALEICALILNRGQKDPDILFMKARILLTAVADEKNGLATLDEALAAGFNDEVLLSSLLEAPDLVNPSAVKEKIENRPKAAAGEAEEAAKPAHVNGAANPESTGADSP
jgi:tetratricopeptide (TPR) repeat protein